MFLCWIEKWREIIGIVGALFLQELISRYDEFYSCGHPYGGDKRMDNTLILLSHLYNFKVHSKSSADQKHAVPLYRHEIQLGTILFIGWFLQQPNILQILGNSVCIGIWCHEQICGQFWWKGHRITFIIAEKWVKLNTQVVK